MQALVPANGIDEYYPSVLVSYATGSRTAAGDAPGCGPGMLYAQAVVEELHQAGVPSFSGLHVPAGTDWHVFVEKLSGRFSACKVLVVVLTPAFFLSKACLVEVSAALDAGVKVLPVLFENPIPRAAEQWPMIERTDAEGKMMLLKVQRDFGRLNTIPSPPGSILGQDAAVLKARVVAIVMSLGGGASAGAQKYFEQGARSQERLEHERWQPAAPAPAAAAVAVAGATGPVSGAPRDDNVAGTAGMG